MKSFAYMEMRLLMALLACLSFLSAQAAENQPVNAPTSGASTNAAAPKPIDDALSALRKAVAESAAPAAAKADEPAPVKVAARIPTAPLEPLDDKMKLSAGDVVRFKIVEDREEAKGLRVTDAGDLDIPYIGAVPAKGRTCKEVALDAKARLEADYYYTATVQLAIEQVMKKSAGQIWVIGQVGAQGPQLIPTDEVWTVSKAILRAGGFNDFANRGKVRVIRKSKGADGIERSEILMVDVGAVLKGKMEKDIPVQDGDNIYVDDQLINFR